MQQSSSSWQSGSERVHAPASLVPPPESFPPLPLPLPASFLPPLPLPLPPLLLPLPPSAELPTHLPAAHESEQQSPYAEQGWPPCLHADVPHFPALQSLLQQSVLVLQALPSGLHDDPGAAQEPAVHAPLQHSLDDVQLVPLLWQPADEHVPETQSLLQQAELDEQLAP